MKFGDCITFCNVYDETKTSNYLEIYKDSCYKRIIRLSKLNNKLEGIVIGETFKCDGIYRVNDKYIPKSFYEEYDSPSFTITARLSFWIVATDMNKTYLVPKKKLDKFRF